VERRGSVLIISLWVMAILAIFAVTIGYQASLNLKLAAYQRDRLKAYYLAEAGIKEAVLELLNDDTPNCDTLQDGWADNEEKFKKITLGDNDDVFATVSFTLNEAGYEKTVFGIVDEDRKININVYGSQGIRLLNELFTSKGLESEAKDGLAQEVMDWINAGLIGAKDTAGAAGASKNNKLRIPEELISILEHFYKDKRLDNDYEDKARQAYSKIKDMITVYTGSQVNINTTSPEVLTILVNSISDSNTEKYAPAFTDDILALRNKKGYFSSLDEIVFDAIKPVEYNTLLGALKEKITVQSKYFKIECTGYAGKTLKHISAIYYRDNNKGQFIYWHEN